MKKLFFLLPLFIKIFAADMNRLPAAPIKEGKRSYHRSFSALDFSLSDHQESKKTLESKKSKCENTCQQFQRSKVLAEPSAIHAPANNNPYLQSPNPDHYIKQEELVEKHKFKVASIQLPALLPGIRMKDANLKIQSSKVGGFIANTVYINFGKIFPLDKYMPREIENRVRPYVDFTDNCPSETISRATCSAVSVDELDLIFQSVVNGEKSDISEYMANIFATPVTKDTILVLSRKEFTDDLYDDVELFNALNPRSICVVIIHPLIENEISYFTKKTIV